MSVIPNGRARWMSFHPCFPSVLSGKLFKILRFSHSIKKNPTITGPPPHFCHHLFPRSFNIFLKFRNNLLPSVQTVAHMVLRDSRRPGLPLCFKYSINGIIIGLCANMTPQWTFPQPHTSCLEHLSRFPDRMPSPHLSTTFIAFITTHNQVAGYLNIWLKSAPPLDCKIHESKSQACFATCSCLVANAEPGTNICWTHEKWINREKPQS